MSRYLIVIEATSTGYSAYSPDLPGCAATGSTRAEVEREMQDAIEFHIEGLRSAGENSAGTLRSCVLRDRGLIFSFSFLFPQPSTWVAGALAFAALAFTQRRKFLRAIARR